MHTLMFKVGTEALMGKVSWNATRFILTKTSRTFSVPYGNICFPSEMNIISQSATIPNIYHISKRTQLLCKSQSRQFYSLSGNVF